MPRWWNWQTRYLEGVVAKTAVRVRVPPWAPKERPIYGSLFFGIRDSNRRPVSRRSRGTSFCSAAAKMRVPPGQMIVTRENGVRP